MSTKGNNSELALHMIAMISALAESEGPVAEACMYRYLYECGYDSTEANAVIKGMVELGFAERHGTTCYIPTARAKEVKQVFDRPALVQ